MLEYLKPNETKDNADFTPELPKISAHEKEILDLLLGNSPAIQKVKSNIIKIAALDVPVFISGESGTGKNLVASIIHKLSPRRNNKFIEINSAQKENGLLESSFYGSKKGAFTDSVEREGLFLKANGGTLFFDEIGEISISTQKELLRFLQFKTFYPLGSDTEISSDVRFIFATNANINKKLTLGELRRDFISRISGIKIKMPELRNHLDDLPILIEAIMKKHCENYNFEAKPLNNVAMARLENHNYPGNVRELENVLMRALVNATGKKEIQASDIEFDDFY